MAAIPYDVAHSFIVGKAARRGNFHATANELWSYGLLLAYKVAGDARIFVRVKPRSNSATTNRHIQALYAVLEWDNVPYEFRP